MLRASGHDGKRRRTRKPPANHTAYRARTARKPTAISVEPRSLAILPLQNLREDTDSDFLGFSLADAVITKLDYVSSLLDAQMFLGNLLVDTGKVEKAVPLLRDALKMNANYAPVHWELGYAYRFAGMLKESVAECERAREIDPSVKSNSSVLNTYLYLGQYEKFLDSLPEVDDSSFLLFYRGLGEYYEKDLEKASRDFGRSYEADPTLYSRIGKALNASIAHKEAEGLETLRSLESKITERGVGDPEGAYKIAQAYTILGDKISALRVLRQSIESGFFCYPYVATDPLLNGIRDEPDFNAILEIAHRRQEAFKEAFF